SRSSCPSARKHGTKCSTHSGLRGEHVLEFSSRYGTRRGRSRIRTNAAQRNSTRVLINDEGHLFLRVSIVCDNTRRDSIPRTRVAAAGEDSRAYARRTRRSGDGARTRSPLGAVHTCNPSRTTRPFHESGPESAFRVCDACPVG